MHPLSRKPPPPSAGLTRSETKAAPYLSTPISFRGSATHLSSNHQPGSGGSLACSSWAQESCLGVCKSAITWVRPASAKRLTPCLAHSPTSKPPLITRAPKGKPVNSKMGRAAICNSTVIFTGSWRLCKDCPVGDVFIVKSLSCSLFSAKWLLIADNGISTL